ncbi:hypothetical protein CBR_g44332 [Chara braunii]|uniref:non-specific serine/threonine protein kinase n=1 Tax=Chara braunii TaxID=69332 RepID=A0A388K323_CHABU|nr:hypothetical protein CBR_g44332 [Chara braunii]|eukprot:GBG64446.1 hypothetical protein CBR_g44332 [Chara braunii]
MFHLQPVRDRKGELQYFIGVQLDATTAEREASGVGRLTERDEQNGKRIVQSTAGSVDDAVKELPDASKPETLWEKHSAAVLPKPHHANSDNWKAIIKVREKCGRLTLKNFRPIRPLGSGDTGSVHLVELVDTGKLFAMKAMDKQMILNRNKLHRVCTERDILGVTDHPFLPTLYVSFQTRTHVCLVTDYCPGGELYALLEKQPMKRIYETAARCDLQGSEARKCSSARKWSHSFD